jgi:hypothetical protein
MGVTAITEISPKLTTINCSKENYEILINDLVNFNYEISEKILNKFRFNLKIEKYSKFCGIVKLNSTSIIIKSGYLRNEYLISKYDENKDLPFEKEYNEDIEIIKNHIENFFQIFFKIYNIYILKTTYKRYHSSYYAD